MDPKGARSRHAGAEGWFSAAVLRETWGRTHSSWRALPSGARQAWGRTFGGWAVLAVALTVALVALGRSFLEPGPPAWEESFLRSLDAQTFVSFNTALWIEALGNGFILWGVLLLAAGVAGWSGRPLLAASLVCGFGSLYLTIFLSWFLWPRERPLLIAEGIASPGSLSSFPSGHVAQAAFAYGMLAYLWGRASRSRAERFFAATAVLLVVFVVGFGRLRLGAHWPTDIAAGIFVGSLWLVAAVLALRRGEAAESRG